MKCIFRNKDLGTEYTLSDDNVKFSISSSDIRGNGGYTACYMLTKYTTEAEKQITKDNVLYDFWMQHNGEEFDSIEVAGMEYFFPTKNKLRYSLDTPVIEGELNFVDKLFINVFKEE